jgi:hypothetical protein
MNNKQNRNRKKCFGRLRDYRFLLLLGFAGFLILLGKTIIIFYNADVAGSEKSWSDVLTDPDTYWTVLAAIIIFLGIGLILALGGNEDD